MKLVRPAPPPPLWRAGSLAAGALTLLACLALLFRSASPRRPSLLLPVMELPLPEAAEAGPTPSPSPRPDPADPHIALCITGSLRTFLLPPVYESIHERLVAPHPRGSVDVYLFLTTAHSQATSHAHGLTDAECSAAPLRAALDLLQPAHVELFPHHSGCESGVRFGDNEPCCNQGNIRPLACACAEGRPRPWLPAHPLTLFP